jgi:membrane protease YdiL (CAAX protease family)
MDNEFNPIKTPPIIEKFGIKANNTLGNILVMCVLGMAGFLLGSLLTYVTVLYVFKVPSLVEFQNIVNNQPEALGLNPGYLQAIKFSLLLNQICMFGLPALAFGWLQGPQQDFLRAGHKVPYGLVGLGLVLIVAFMPAVSMLTDLNQRLWLPANMHGIENWIKSKEAANDRLTHVIMQMTSLNDFFINLIIVGIAAGFCEELLFRGVLQNIIFKSTRKLHASIWISAILFSAFHMQFYGFVPRMCIGALLGYMYASGGSIYVNAAMHAFFNGLQVLLIYLYQADIIKINIDDTETQPSYVLGVLSLLLTSLAVYNLLKRYTPQKSTV